ncbi:unnamed protein product [Rangifer tarandus platyrhynchus]|uniref:Uncharacterized protein n=1 Tax=Rangifer tarandus platyrhynchus TaxID=3082113 RepID=A0AC59YAH6_RANTA
MTQHFWAQDRAQRGAWGAAARPLEAGWLHLLYARLHSWRRRPSKVSICILVEETRSAEQAQEQRRSFQRERSPMTETHRGVRELHRSERASLKRLGTGEAQPG